MKSTASVLPCRGLGPAGRPNRYPRPPCEPRGGRRRAVLPSFEHASEPVKSCVGIRIADGLVQCRDQVVCSFAGFVVDERPLLQCSFGDVFANHSSGIASHGCRNFKHVAGGPSIAVGVDRISRRTSAAADTLRSPSPRSLSASARCRSCATCSSVSASEHKHGNGKQRRVDLERWILRGCPDQPDIAFSTCGRRRPAAPD